MASTPVPRDRGDFHIAILCALTLEAECVINTLDHVWKDQRYDPLLNDDSAYTLGTIGRHNVVIIHMPGMGRTRATSAVHNAFVGGMPTGVEGEDILLGDVVISKALIQYDFGKQYPNGFKRNTDIPNNLGAPNEKILGLLSKLETRQYKEDLETKTFAFLHAIQEKSSKAKYPGSKHDILYASSYAHQHRTLTSCYTCINTDETCETATETKCEDLGCESVAPRLRSTTRPTIHVGRMGCADTVMKSGHHRDSLARKEKVIAVEMEGAGVWRYGPSIVIKGVCDYADSHKRKNWQRYAAAAAAACTKAFLLEWWAPEKRDKSLASLTQIDNAIRQAYNNGRLRIERLSGKSLSLKHCFINLNIIRHVHDSEDLNRDKAPGQVSRFSLAARLGIETPSASDQISLRTLFEPRERKDGTKFRPTRILIWGRAGMGKTTLCKKIADEVSNNGLWKDLYDRVIWLPLRRLKKVEVRDVVELLQHEFFLSGLDERLSEGLRKLISDDRTLLLLDGLDEVSLTLDRDSPAGRILHDLVSRSHVIITSRPHSMRILDQKAPDLELETVGFFPQQVDEYIQRVAAEPQTAVEIMSFIQSHPLVQSLARIPIQLDAICYTWRIANSSQRVVTMTNLYLVISRSLWRDTIIRLGKKTTDGELITRQQLEYGLSPEDFVRQEIDFLQELAFRGLWEETIDFGTKDITRTKAGRQIPGDKCIHLSFLRASDTSIEVSDRTLHFIHLTFQEFFAAQCFVRHWMSSTALPLNNTDTHRRELNLPTGPITPENFVRSEKYIDRYDIFWRFVVGLLHTEQDHTYLYKFFRVLKDSPIDLVGRTHQRLLIHCLSEIDSDYDQPDPHVRKIEEDCLQWILCVSKLRRGRQGLSHSKSLVWETECSDYILEKLVTESDIAQEVLEALCRRSSISSCLLDMILNLLSKDCDSAIRTAATQVIGEFCGPDQREKFTKFWHNVRGDKLTLLMAIKAWQGSQLLEPAIQALVSLLQDPDSSVQYKAAHALGGQATLPATAVEALVSLLQDPDSLIRHEATITLRRQATLPATAVEALVSLLQHRQPSVYGEEVMDFILSRQEILLRLPDFTSVVLQHFVQWWSQTDSTICFIWEHHIYIRSSGILRRIQLQDHQLQLFRSQWLKAQNDLQLPSLLSSSSTYHTERLQDSSIKRKRKRHKS